MWYRPQTCTWQAENVYQKDGESNWDESAKGHLCVQLQNMKVREALRNKCDNIDPDSPWEQF